MRHCLTAIEAGGATLKPLLERIAELDKEGRALAHEKSEIEQRVSETRLNRPPAQYVQLMWSSFLKLWDAGTEAEKADLIHLVVGRVELADQERGYCRLLFAPDEPYGLKGCASGNVAVNGENGADDGT